jgi:type VI secretion system secreted protein Hcp
MADSIALTLTANGTDIEGDNPFTTLERENKIDVLSLVQPLRGAFDRGTARASGRRFYEPLRFTKRIDRATPQLRQALVSNATLAGEFRWYRTNSGDGETEHFFTLQFEDARFTSAVLRLPDLLDPAASSLPPIEEIEMVSNVYRWIWPQGSVEFEDTFTAHS